MRLRTIQYQTWITTLTLGFILSAIPAQGHHSVAMFDKTKTVTLKGTVKEFQWTNPHVVIWIDAESVQGGNPDLWAVEMTSPGVLIRNGWTKRSLKVGDKVSIDVGPMRDGKSGGIFKKATILETGKVLTYIMQPQDGPGSN
jgi:hypothetical protein